MWSYSTAGSNNLIIIIMVAKHFPVSSRLLIVPLVPTAGHKPSVF